MNFEARDWPVFSQPGQLLRFLRERRDGAFRCIYAPLRDPREASGVTLEEHFEHVGRMALAAKNLILYVDEIDMLCSPAALKAKNSSYWSRPENQTRTPVLEDILNRGRHAGVAGIFISRVPAQVHGLVRSMASEMRIFRASEGTIINYFKARDESLAQLLPTLGDFEYALWQDGKTPVRAGGRR